MKGKQKSTTGIGASLTPDYREKEESNNMLLEKVVAWNRHCSVVVSFDVRCHIYI